MRSNTRFYDVDMGLLVVKAIIWAMMLYGISGIVSVLFGWPILLVKNEFHDTVIRSFIKQKREWLFGLLVLVGVLIVLEQVFGVTF